MQVTVPEKRYTRCDVCKRKRQCQLYGIFQLSKEAYDYLRTQDVCDTCKPFVLRLVCHFSPDRKVGRPNV